MKITARIRQHLRKSVRSTAAGNDAVVREDEELQARRAEKAQRQAAHEAMLRAHEERRSERQAAHEAMLRTHEERRSEHDTPKAGWRTPGVHISTQNSAWADFMQHVVLRRPGK